MATRYPMFIVNTTIPMLVGMNPNPMNISIESSKIYSKNQTLGGWVFEHWGEQPQMIRVKGRTKAIVGNFENELGIEATLFQLQQIYRLDKKEVLSILPAVKDGNPFSALDIKSSVKNAKMDVSTLRKLSNTFIYYKFDAYAGFFTKFNFQQDAEHTPRWYTYDFEFLATKTAQNFLSDSIFAPDTSSIPRAISATGAGVALSAPALALATKTMINAVKKNF